MCHQKNIGVIQLLEMKQKVAPVYIAHSLTISESYPMYAIGSWELKEGLGVSTPAPCRLIYGGGSRTVNSGVVVASPTLLLIFS